MRRIWWWVLGLLLLFVTLWKRQPSLTRAQTPPWPGRRRVIAPSFRPPADGDKVRLALFDADSTLRVAPSGKVSANAGDDVAILPLVAPTLARVASEGYLIAILSNQAGIEHGYITATVADQALQTTMARLAAGGGSVHYYDFAEGKGPDRKPELGMLERLAGLVKRQLGRDIDWAGSFMVGDAGWKEGVDREPDGSPGEDVSDSDRRFAENARQAFGGMQFFHPREFFGWKAYGIKNFKTYQDLEKAWQAHPDLRPDSFPSPLARA
jgi:DNA 3'-phosphatase